MTQPSLAQTSQSAAQPPRVEADAHHDQSAPLRDLSRQLAPQSAQALQGEAVPLRPLPRASGNPATGGNLLAPSNLISGSMPAPSAEWDGMSNQFGVVPPDTNGDVGPNHYVQWVNLALEVWNKQGTSLLGPIAGNTIWSGFGGPCETTNYGDPIVLYDGLANRWFISQFSVPGSGPFYQCVAVSTTPDPTGTWYRYAFLWSQNVMNDYPKFGVWPDGYYMSVNQFSQPGDTWAGAGVAVLERSAMLQGLPARMFQYDLFNANANYGGLLPADLDGMQAPPPGAPNPFVEWDDGSLFGTSDALRLWNFHVDWNVPANSSFGVSLQPNLVIPTSNVNPNYNNPYRIPQKGTTTTLDAISDRLMYRLQYRNFGDHQSLVSNHTVDASAGVAGIHWFELRSSAGSAWSLYQEGLYAPDGHSRWMGSASLDASGDLALGYSLSGTDIFPSIAYAGRLASDPPGTLPQSEVQMVVGGGAQTTSYRRWGDYSSMSVDPSDDCTFWYTQEYYAATSTSGWRTHIGAFKFPSCNQPDTGILQGTVTSQINGLPLSGAQVDIGGSTVFTASNGSYQALLPVGSINVQVSAFGYATQTQPAAIVKGATTTLDFALTTINTVKLSGTVSDGSGHVGMPLYARIDITGLPASPVFTDPLTGGYQVDLMQGVAYSLTVSAVNGGYLPASAQVTVPPDSSTQNFALQVDPAACPLGYITQTGACQAQPGGLVVGTVRDANNPPNPAPVGLVGATVMDSGNGASASTESDPAGLYFLFTYAGTRTLAASASGYSTIGKNVNVLTNGATGANFDLTAGYLRVTPVQLGAALNWADPTATLSLEVKNLGSAPASYTLAEFNGSPPDIQPTGPFAAAGRRIAPPRLAGLTAENVYEYVPPVTGTWPGAGQVLHAWPTGLAAPWGIGVTTSGEVWVSDALAGGGDGQDHPYDGEGGPQAGALATAWNGAYAGDLAYDPVTNRFWQVNVGGDNCIYEVDPEARAATGRTICPPFGNPQRGLAYDPRSQTFYSGTWADGILSHFDRAGRLLDSVNLGINIAGLAYQPESGHLFALSNANQGYDIYVLDVRHAYAILGGFDVPGLTDFGQAGLEMAPDGSLWVVDFQARQVLQVTSGEAAYTPLVDVPWLNENPVHATLPPGSSQTVTVSLDASKLTPGSYPAYLTVTTNTPYDLSAYRIAPIPVELAVHYAQVLPLVMR